MKRICSTATLALALFGAVVVLPCMPDTATAQEKSVAREIPYELLLLKGNLARGRRQFSIAEHYFAAAARKKDATPQVFLYWTRMLRDQGNLNRAMKVVEIGRKRFPQSAALLFEHGFLLLFAERYDEVRALLDELSDQDRTHPFAQYIRGRLYLEQGKPKDAIAPLKAAATAKHLYQADAWALLAEAQARAGRHSEALESLQQAIALAPSAQQKAIYQDRLKALQEAEPALYTLSAMTGLYWDTNVNLAPLLFASSQAGGARLLTALDQRLRLLQNDRHRLHLAATLTQTLHAGADYTVLDDFNATSFAGSLRGADKLSDSVRLSWQVQYDSTYLFFRPSGDETHFSERWSGGPILQYLHGKWLTAIGLAGTWTRFYADNQIGTVDDRSTATIDLAGNLSVRRTLTAMHALTVLASAVRNDARGSNFDNFGLSSRLNWEMKIDRWLLTTGTGFQWQNYPDNQDGRNDQVLSVALQARLPIGKRHILGASIVYDENLSKAADIYAYRRFVIGLLWQGRLLQL